MHNKNASKSGHFGLIIYLKGYNSDLKLVRRSTNQDFNNKLEQKIMSVLEFLIPIKEIKVWKDNYSEPFWLSDMKRKRKNLIKNARRRESTRLFKRCKEMDQKIRKGEQKSSKKKNCAKIFKGGQSGLWDAIKMAQNKP